MSTQILKEIIKRGWIPVIKVEESLHKGIKEGIRKLAAKSYNDHLDIYKKRCLIESFIGTTKGMYGRLPRRERPRQGFSCSFRPACFMEHRKHYFCPLFGHGAKGDFQTGSVRYRFVSNNRVKFLQDFPEPLPMCPKGQHLLKVS